MAAQPKTKTYPLLSRREIEGLIADGRKVFILDQHVIKADAWMPYHPGGDKAIQHMVGRDATDEVTALHSREAKQQMSRYRIGRIEGRWKNFLPPIQGGKFRSLADDAADEYSIDTTFFLPQSTASVASSNSNSRDPSPLFDTDDSSLRIRRGPSPVSSAASVVEADDGMSHLDTVTREKITLDLEKYPSLDPTTQDSIVSKYRLLNERIKAEGLYQCNYGAYGIEACRYSLFFALFLTFLRLGWYIPSAVFLGCFWHQLTFTAHDAGHMGITHGYHTDSLIGMFIANFLGGLSLGWWKRNHNVHHIVTNSPEHDPDIEYVPIFAVSHRFLGSLRSTYYDRVMTYDAAAKVLLRIQAWTYYPIMLVARFNLYFLSWGFILGGHAPKKGPSWWHRYFELLGMSVFWFWYGYLVVYKSVPTNWERLVFLLVSHAVTSPVHIQITLSHFAMSTSDLGPNESFPQKMLRTTMDVDCPQWLDFFHGGLQFQAIHHLYPRIPRHNLRRTQKLVQEFCNEVDIPYALYGFVDGNKQVVSNFAEVSRQAAILAKCQKTIVENGEHLHLH